MYLSMNLINSNHRGFTLLELLIVLFIIGTMAAVSLSFIDQEDGQQRYTDSIQRLNLITDAIVKVKNHGHNQQIISGFVFDNGTLPPIPTSGSDEIQPLIDFNGIWDDHATSPASSWLPFGNLRPIYTSDGKVIELTDHVQFKGYRGPYLPTASLDSDSKFRDLWNMEYELETPSGSSFSYTLGNVLSDGATKKFESFNASVTQETSTEQWSVALGQLAFTVINSSGSTISSGKKVSLIVFDNSFPLPWQTYRFKLAEIAIGETQLYGFGATSATLATIWYRNSSTEALTDVDATRIPIGSHLVIIIDEGQTTVADAVKANTQILLMPGSSIPNITLKIR
jgi:prepilin-type N-terminal cleavage/methylation domain-containing protein